MCNHCRGCEFDTRALKEAVCEANAAACRAEEASAAADHAVQKSVRIAEGVEAATTMTEKAAEKAAECAAAAREAANRAECLLEEAENRCGSCRYTPTCRESRSSSLCDY